MGHVIPDLNDQYKAFVCIRVKRQTTTNEITKSTQDKKTSSSAMAERPCELDWRF